jgi:hypothetical protein
VVVQVGAVQEGQTLVLQLKVMRYRMMLEELNTVKVIQEVQVTPLLGARVEVEEVQDNLAQGIHYNQMIIKVKVVMV